MAIGLRCGEPCRSRWVRLDFDGPFQYHAAYVEVAGVVRCRILQARLPGGPLVEVKSLVSPDLMIEIEAMAVIAA